METWSNDPNKRAIAIVRRSSQGQKDNTSAETQQHSIEDYAHRNCLNLLKIEPIIETAYISENRTKYQELMKYALANGIKHILFYIGSREARNLTDTENNEKLIKEDKIIIHHVSDGKVYWKESPDSDFLNRDLLSAVNKHQSRENSTKMKAAYQTKAKSGWWPYRHTALGYVHAKQKDAYGNPIKGTATIAVNPDMRIVKLVQSEFNLRAKGLSIDEIREKNLSLELVPSDTIKKYSRASIGKRLNDPFYWGYFFLSGDPTRFEGIHEKIIDAKTLSAVKAINDGKTRKKSVIASNGEDVFRGWLRCAHPECNRLISYDPKKKKLKSDGTTKIYHYYSCPNDLKLHDKKATITEDKIWEQFEMISAGFSITEEFARDIAEALNETHLKQKAAIKKQMDGFRYEQKILRTEKNQAVSKYVTGNITKEDYNEFCKDLDHRDDHYTNEIERLTLAISDEAMVSVQKIFELAINAKSLWKSMERADRLEYLKKVVSNQTLDGLTVRYQIKKPFTRLASWKGNLEWRRERDSNS